MDAAFDRAHPAVTAALSTVGPGEVRAVRGVVIRGAAAVVLLADDSTRRAVILTLASGVWTLPTMLGGGSTWNPGDRPAHTRAPWALVQPATSQSGPPRPNGAPPAAAWMALSGVAAADALSVVLRSTLDQHEVQVPPDGVVLALLRAPWGAKPEITVRTRDADIRHVAP